MRYRAHCAPVQWKQFDPSFRVIDQRPLRSTFITKPKMLHDSAMLPRADKGRRGRLPGGVDALGFDQEQFPLTQFQEGFSAFGICTLAEHDFPFFLPASISDELS
jgi:hypothetical protein